ncbi:capsule biosynthesis protein [Paracoccus shandongensis]|uniref:capsule biosynthesis protein n=1 Tax=Paracoccus shandongensis TaxID=2816048 RepID=UPI001A8E8F93|nr:capsule biosynthesis protein [Paracoccus shandongensis]
MTTPPKVRRYHASAAESVRPDLGGEAASSAERPFSDTHIRLSVRKKAEAPDVPPQNDDRERFMRTDPVDDGLLAHVKPPEAPAPTSEEDLDSQLEAIRAENLSERQLRIARRIAALHQIEVASDEEAVLRLRQRGIDPSHRAALGQILSSEGSRAQAKPAANTPAVMPKRPSMPAARPGTEVGPVKPDLPSREALTEEKRAAEIFRIQRDIAKRRRRRMFLLGLRLLAFVILPTALAGWYYFRVATPLYATVSQFRIQSAEGQGSSGSGLGGLLSGSQLATNTDSVAVQSYLTSRDAMLRLDADKGFRAAYQDPAIDPVKRLTPDATNEETFALYRKSVKIGYDPTEGMIDMEVIAPDPQQSQDFSLALIAYAEEQVDQMTSRLRDDQMKGAIEIYEDAEAKVLAAQRRVQELQQSLGVLDPAAEGTVVMTQISALETQLATKRLELGQLLANPQPQQSRVTALRGDITRLQEMIAETRTQLTEGDDSRSSLALISGELRIAESDLLTRQELLAGAAAQMESARIEANKQVRYLSLSVAPVSPDEATYPKAFQNTLVAFLIFSGIYLMLSLTASILREQVST